MGKTRRDAVPPVRERERYLAQGSEATAKSPRPVAKEKTQASMIEKLYWTQLHYHFNFHCGPFEPVDGQRAT